MTKHQKITLSASRDIPFDKLMLSQSNVRQVKSGISIEELAEDIARRTLLTALTVRPVLDETGAETGRFEIPAGGRRFRALELLVKQKRLARNAPVPCIIRLDGLAEEDSLAENIQRAPLHPLDQFRAFQAMREKGRSEEEIAAAFFVTAGVVKQRLKLAAVSPVLLEAYAEDALTLDQLMAFTVCPNPDRQEQVWEALQHQYMKAPHEIRRMLTEGAVRASDKRARFIGLEAYVEAGGTILRDLFQQDDGGWLQDATLLDLMVADRLAEEADKVRSEGWKWVEAAPDFPYGHTWSMRRLRGTPVEMTEDERARHEVLRAEYTDLEAEYAEHGELPEAIEERMDELNAALEALETRPLHFDPAEQAIAGVFLSLDNAWGLRIDRGFVRREDEPAPDPIVEMADTDADPARGTAPSTASETGPTDGPASDEDDEEGGRPLPERLITDLTAHRTLALTDALAQDPEVAYLAALHVLALRQFYRTGSDSCLEISPRTVLLGVQTTPDLAEAPYAIAVQARHEAWEKRLPQDPAALWGVLTGFERERRDALFAHCVSLTVNGIHDPYQRKPRAMAHADVLASTVGLDMVRAGWEPTVASYFGRLTKAQILETVHEARGSIAADRIAALKKPAMAAAAEELLTDKGWLPPILRTAPLPQEIEGDFVLVTIEGDPAGDGVEGAVVSELAQGEPEDGAHDPSPEDADESAEEDAIDPDRVTYRTAAE